VVIEEVSEETEIVPFRRPAERVGAERVGAERVGAERVGAKRGRVVETMGDIREAREMPAERLDMT
jgi:hypothetical protein